MQIGMVYMSTHETQHYDQKWKIQIRTDATRKMMLHDALVGVSGTKFDFHCVYVWVGGSIYTAKPSSSVQFDRPDDSVTAKIYNWI